MILAVCLHKIIKIVAFGVLGFFKSFSWLPYGGACNCSFLLFIEAVCSPKAIAVEHPSF